MLDNTYDAPGINFGILISTDFPSMDDQVFKKNDIEAIENQIDKICNNKNCNILDFSKIDGLTIDEILNHNRIQLKNTIIVIAYTKMSYTNRFNEKYNDINILSKIIVNRNDLNKNTTIDKEVEKIMMNSYNSINNRVVNYCFLERYRYGSKDEVDKVLTKTN